MIKTILLALTLFSSTVFHKGENGYDTYRIPAVIQAPDGSLLAFAEARRDGAADNGRIDLVMKSSTDGGRNWNAAVTVWSEEGYSCGNPAPVVDSRSGRILLVGTRNAAADSESAICNGSASDSRRVFIMFSDDSGRSWSPAREITSEAKRADWGWYATGPCHAIQLQDFRFNGRIVIPCDHSVIKDGKFAGYGSHVIISDDGGQSWRIGGICPGGNESSAAELPDGTVILNMRVQDKELRASNGNCRIQAVSYNGGETFQAATTAEGLVEPCCQGSILNYSNKGENTNIVLFCNPSDRSRRANLTVQASADNGRSWHKVACVREGLAAYSDLCTFKNGDIGVIYENGEISPYEKISFSIVQPEIAASARQAWSDDKYSMFIHFGVYSELGGVWKGKPVTYGYSEQIQQHGGIQDDLYIKAARNFNPVNFNADEIVALAKEAGMRSIVITSKHHDGYCLFNTGTTDFNSMNYCGRDFIRELSEACARGGMKFGLYFSLIDWHDPYGNRITSHNANWLNPEHHVLNVRQVSELVSSYGPISELWFDMGRLTKAQSEELYRTVHLWQPNCMVSGRLGNDCYDFCVMSDNSYPDGTLKTAWQAPASMFNATWGYRSWQERKDADGNAREKLCSLLGTVSHGGNYILNIGPKGDGSVVKYEREVLVKIGNWLKVNGKAVYSTKAFAWPGVDSWGWCTQNGNELYLIPSKVSADSTVSIPLGSAILKKACWLDNGKKIATSVKGKSLSFTVPKSNARAELPRVIRLVFDKVPEEPIGKITDITNLSCLVTDQAIEDYSYSCTYYYDNHQSTVAYNWYVKGKATKRLKVTGPEGRRINLSVDGVRILKDAPLPASVLLPKRLVSKELHNIYVNAADMDNPHTDIKLEDLRIEF